MGPRRYHPGSRHRFAWAFIIRGDLSGAGSLAPASNSARMKSFSSDLFPAFRQMMGKPREEAGKAGNDRDETEEKHRSADLVRVAVHEDEAARQTPQ